MKMRNFKKNIFILFVMAFVATGVCACGKKEETKPVEEWDEKDFESAANKLESEFDETKKEEKEVTEPESTEEIITYEVSDEIVNSKLSDGLIQIGDDVFREGGYISVAELYEQYSDKYDFTIHYKAEVGLTTKTYDIPYDPEFAPSDIDNNHQSLVMTSKEDPDLAIDWGYYSLDIYNREEKIENKIAFRVLPDSPKAIEYCWLSGNLPYTNNELTEQELVAFLEANGLTKGESEGNYYTEEVSTGEIRGRFTIEEVNRFDYTPSIEFMVTYDPETAKMRPQTKVYLYYFDYIQL